MQITLTKNKQNISLPIDFRTTKNDSIYLIQTMKKTKRIGAIQFIVIFQGCQNKTKLNKINIVKKQMQNKKYKKNLTWDNRCFN